MVKSNIPAGITRVHVLRAIEDFRQGVPHEFGESTKYDLVHDGERLPPKAIVGLAARQATGILLTPRDFSGGEESVCFRLLRELGFTVEPKTGQDWSEPECYFAVWGYDQLDLDRARVKKALYRELGELLGRSPKSVEFKIQDVSACDPRHRTDKPINEATHKQALLQGVFDDYWADRETARAREPEVRELLKFPEARLPSGRGGSKERPAGSIYIEEGLASEETTRTRTRSRQLLDMGRDHFRGIDREGKLRCSACGYTSPAGLANGKEVVQLHHTRPLADADEAGHRIELQEALGHLLPLCPNCHVIAHTAKPPLPLDAIRRIVAS